MQTESGRCRKARIAYTQHMWPDVATRSVLADGTLLSVAGGGESRLWSPAPGVIQGRAKGYGAAALMDAIITDMKLLVGFEDGWLVFTDYSELTGYDAKARIAAIKW